MSCRDAGAELVQFERARDQNHSYSFGGASSCAQNGPAQVRARQAAGTAQIVLSYATLKPLSVDSFQLMRGILMQYAG